MTFTTNIANVFVNSHFPTHKIGCSAPLCTTSGGRSIRPKLDKSGVKIYMTMYERFMKVYMHFFLKGKFVSKPLL